MRQYFFSCLQTGEMTRADTVGTKKVSLYCCCHLQKMERSRSHIVASAQLNVFFVYTLMLYIFVMKSQNRAKLACLYKLWAPKLYFAKKRKTSLGGPKMLRESIFFNKIGSCRGVHIFKTYGPGGPYSKSVMTGFRRLFTRNFW